MTAGKLLGIYECNVINDGEPADQGLVANDRNLQTVVQR